MKWGQGFITTCIYVHSGIEYLVYLIRSSFDPLTTTNFFLGGGGAQPPLSKSGGLKPPLPHPPMFSASVTVCCKLQFNSRCG